MLARLVGAAGGQRMAMASASGRKSDMSLGAAMNCRFVDLEEPGYRILGKTEIPTPIARDDLINSIQLWAMNELREILEEKHDGCKILVDYEEDQVTEPDSYSLTLRYVAPTGEFIVLEFCLDNEEFATTRTIEGFQVEDKPESERPRFVDQQGNLDPRTISMVGTDGTQKGRSFVVRRKESELPEPLRPIILDTMKEISNALSRYYAFGSLFLDDAL